MSELSDVIEELEEKYDIPEMSPETREMVREVAKLRD